MGQMTTPPPVTGIYTAIVTPFQDEATQALDFKAFDRLLDSQLEAGVDGLVPCGTTGESPSLSNEEQLTLIRHTVNRARGKAKVLAGTGTNATRTTIERSQAAVDVGADAVMVVVPYYNKPTQEGLFRHFKAVAESTRLPIILYSIPGRCGVEIAVDTVLRLARACPNIVAIKEAGGTVERVNQLHAALPPEFTILSGDDALTLPFMTAGAEGVISVASNIYPREMVRIVQSFADGRLAEARELHAHYYPLFRDLFIETSPVPIKTALALAGRISGELRLPLCEMAPANAAKLLATLRTLNLVK